MPRSAWPDECSEASFGVDAFPLPEAFRSGHDAGRSFCLGSALILASRALRICKKELDCGPPDLSAQWRDSARGEPTREALLLLVLAAAAFLPISVRIRLLFIAAILFAI